MEKQTLARAVGSALRGGSPSVAGTTVSPSGRFSRYGCACAQNDKLYRRVRVILYGLTLFNRTKRTRFLSGALVEKSPRGRRTGQSYTDNYKNAVSRRGNIPEGKTSVTFTLTPNTRPRWHTAAKYYFLFKKFLTNGKRGYIIY